MLYARVALEEELFLRQKPAGNLVCILSILHWGSNTSIDIPEKGTSFPPILFAFTRETWATDTNMGFAVLLLLGLAGASGAVPDTLVVNTPAGRVRGVGDHSVPSGLPFYSFQGMPYAKPPTGKLRFRNTLKARFSLRTENSLVKCRMNFEVGRSEDGGIVLFLPEVQISVAVCACFNIRFLE